MIQLEEKLYTSTEVADILGVSLRSVYRYIEEDKLNPEVKTATGRHRFTKQNILDFLYPKGDIPNEEVSQETTKPQSKQKDKAPKQSKVVEEPITPKDEDTIKTEAVEETSEEPIDWLAKFREAAKRFEETDKPVAAEKEAEEPAVSKEPAFEAEQFTGFASTEEKHVPVKEEQNFYYRSRLGGLKDIAQNIDKTSRNSGVDYAFTLNAGLSLYRAIKPFSMLHVYVKSRDRDFFERILMLTPSDENNAQLCLIVSDDKALYDERDEMHGLFVVSKAKLDKDVDASSDDSLKEEASSILK